MTVRRAWTRRLGIGRLAYWLWHAPLAPLRESLRNGGPWEQRRTERGRLEMERAAGRLPPLQPTAEPPLVVHLLTGRRFWFQSAFCLHTFGTHARRAIQPVIYDDGTLAPEQRESLHRLFPAMRVVGQAEALAHLDSHLPAARFPFLRERWLNYPNIRKLIDPHLGRTGWKLVIDSDLLFFRRPDALLDWLDAPREPLHGVDCETCYGYSRPVMESLAGAPLAERVNVGLCGLDSSALDWERLESWCRTLIEREGTHYFLEQALVAMLVAGRRCAVAPAEEYITLPRAPEDQACRAVMHHYVADSKRAYFQRNWRRCLGDDANRSMTA